MSGDEPHYLLITESLLTDHDIDLANNYAQNDGRLFGHDGLMNDGHAFGDATGRLTSAHDMGIAVVLLPVYAVARAIGSTVPAGLLVRARMSRGLFVYSLVSVFLLVTTSIASTFIVTRGATLTKNDTSRLAIAAAMVIVLAPPILSHAFLVFPETLMYAVTAFVVAGALRPPTLIPRRAYFFAAAVALGCAPWLHRKFSAFVLALAGALAWRMWDELKRTGTLDRIVMLLLLLVPHLALHGWTLATWGTILGPQFRTDTRLDITGIPQGLLGLFADRQYGLIAYSPFYLLLPACVVLARPALRPFLLAAVTLIVPMAAFDEWWGGFSPAARYLVPVLPIATLAIIDGYARPRLRQAITVMALLQVPLTAVVWQRPRLLWPRDTGSNPLWSVLGNVGDSIQRLLPSVKHDGVGSAIPLTICVTVLTILLIAMARRRGRLPTTNGPATP